MTEDQVTRPLPCAIGPEKSVLSTLLQDPGEFIPLAEEMGLTGNHFYLPSHATLFAVLVERNRAGLEVELVSLTQALLDCGKLDRVGGPHALADLYSYQPTPQHFGAHVGELVTKYTGREMIRLASRVIAEVYDSPDEIPQTLDAFERDALKIRDAGDAGKTVAIKQTVSVVLTKFESELNDEPCSHGLATGYVDFDRMTRGLCASDMIVVGARPSVGKTSFMMNIVERVCVTDDNPVLVFSAEMDSERITQRVIFGRARFALSSLTRGCKPNKGDLLRIQRAAMEVGQSPLFIDDRSGPTIGYLVAKARRMHREHGIRLVAIDYLQLIRSVSRQSERSREREIAEISAALKGLAKDLGIPVLVLAQLGRDVEKRSGKGAPARPRLSDLRESGSIEQDADIVGLLSRGGYQAENPEEADASAELNLAKNRNGETGPVPLTFIADLMRFESGLPKPETSDRY